MDSENFLTVLVIAVGVSVIVRAIGVSDNAIVVAISVIAGILGTIMRNQNENQKIIDDICDSEINKLNDEIHSLKNKR